MALKDNWLITTKDGLINERSKHSDFTTGIGKENEKIISDEKRRVGDSSKWNSGDGRAPLLLP